MNTYEKGVSRLDAAVLIIGGLVELVACLAIRWTRRVDDALATDFGGDD